MKTITLGEFNRMVESCTQVCVLSQKGNAFFLEKAEALNWARARVRTQKEASFSREGKFMYIDTVFTHLPADNFTVKGAL